MKIVQARIHGEEMREIPLSKKNICEEGGGSKKISARFLLLPPPPKKKDHLDPRLIVARKVRVDMISRLPGGGWSLLVQPSVILPLREGGDIKE